MTHLNDPVLALAIKERGLDAEPDFEIGANEAGEITMNVDGTEITADEMANIKDATKVVANPDPDDSDESLTGIQIGDEKYKIVGDGGTTVVANPEGEATGDITKIQVDATIYSIPEGTAVEANPTLDDSDATLTGLQVGDTKYKIPQGTTVVANNGQSASTALTTLQVGNTNYSIGSGSVTSSSLNTTVLDLVGGSQIFPCSLTDQLTLSVKEYGEESFEDYLMRQLNISLDESQGLFAYLIALPQSFNSIAPSSTLFLAAWEYDEEEGTWSTADYQGILEPDVSLGTLEYPDSGTNLDSSFIKVAAFGYSDISSTLPNEMVFYDISNFGLSAFFGITKS